MLFSVTDWPFESPEMRGLMMTEIQFTDAELNTAKQSLKSNYSKIKNQKIMVIGDVGMDEYIWGEVDRVSPEAPVPVVDVTREDQRIGLAGNVAQNIAMKLHFRLANKECTYNVYY